MKHMKMTPAAAIMVVSPALDNPAVAGIAEFTDLESLVFFGFFRTREDRSDFLGELRSEVSHYLRGRQQSTPPVRQEERLASLLHTDPERAALAAVRLAADRGLSYHTYSLRIGYPPYAVSAVLSFVELERTDLEQFAGYATGRMEREKTQLLDAFGLPGFGGPL